MVPQGPGLSVVSKVLELAEGEGMNERFFDKILIAIDRPSAISQPANRGIRDEIHGH